MSCIPPEELTIGEVSKTDTQIWRNLRNYFRERVQTLKQVCEEHGVEAAKLEQAYILKGTEDREAWERMITEGAIRNLRDPKAARIVVEAYDAICNLAMPITSPEEDRLIELQETKHCLFDLHQQIRAKLSAGAINTTDFTLPYDLDQVSERLESYRDLVKTFPEAGGLIERCKVIIIDFRAMIRKGSKK